MRLETGEDSKSPVFAPQGAPLPQTCPERLEEKAQSEVFSDRMPSQHSASYIVDAGRWQPRHQSSEFPFPRHRTM